MIGLYALIGLVFVALIMFLSVAHMRLHASMTTRFDDRGHLRVLPTAEPGVGFTIPGPTYDQMYDRLRVVVWGLVLASIGFTACVAAVITVYVTAR